MMTDHPSEHRPLAERLRERATVAHEAAMAKAEAEHAERVAEREQMLKEGAHAFYLARMEFLQELLAKAADQGKFEWQVWRTTPSSLSDDDAEIARRGLQRVAAWLKEHGFRADLVDRKEDVPDFGMVDDLILTARWDADHSGRNDLPNP